MSATTSAAEYRTHDLVLAAFLHARGARLLRIDGARPPREFVFLGVDEHDVLQFFAGTDGTPARALINSFRGLRQLVQQATPFSSALAPGARS